MRDNIISVITGDVVNSRKLNPEDWLTKIKTTLKSNKVPKSKWGIFRGDMFQIETTPEDALELCIKLKSKIKELKDIDLRLSIGVGAKDYIGHKIQESNGEAYINSGLGFENLNNKNMIIQSPKQSFNEKWTVMLDMALLIMDNWSPITSQIFNYSLENPNLSQKQIAKKLDKIQSSISEALTRAGYTQIINMLSLYKSEISET